MNGTVILEMSNRSHEIENSKLNICFSEQIFYREQSLGAPDSTIIAYWHKGFYFMTMATYL